MTDVRNTGNQPPVWAEPVARPAKKPRRVSEVLQHVPTNNGIKGARPKRQLHLFHVPNKHLIQTISCGAGRRRDVFDADDFGGLTRFNRLTETPRAAANVQNSP